MGLLLAPACEQPRQCRERRFLSSAKIREKLGVLRNSRVSQMILTLFPTLKNHFFVAVGQNLSFFENVMTKFALVYLGFQGIAQGRAKENYM